MNFRNYIRTKLPAPFFNEKWLEKLVNVIFFPYDVSLQVIDYIPNLRNPKMLAKKDLKHLGYEKNMEEYYGEINYANRLKESFNIWENAGSRFGLHIAVESCGFILDDTNFEYGIEERIQYNNENDGYAIWADYANNDINKAILWGHFYWPETDGYNEIDSFGTYAIYISDENESIYQNGNQITNSLFKICKKFAPANTYCSVIYLTDGNGNILHTINNTNAI